MTAPNNAPGLSPIYAAARQMLDAIAPGDSPSMGRAGGYVGTCHASVTRYGNEWALELIDVHRIEAETLTTWAAAVEQPATGWLVDENVGGKVARLAWQGEGKPLPNEQAVTWIGQVR